MHTNTSDSSSAVLDSNVSNNTFNVFKDSFLPVAFQSTSLQPLAFAEKMEENQDKLDSDPVLPLNIDKLDSDPVLPLNTVKLEHTASSVSVNNALPTINEHSKEKFELGSISSDVIFGESVRQELYMFYEVNKPATGSMSPLSRWKPLSPHASFVNRKGLPSAMGNSNGTIKGSGLSTDTSLQSTGNSIRVCLNEVFQYSKKFEMIELFHLNSFHFQHTLFG